MYLLPLPPCSASAVLRLPALETLSGGALGISGIAVLAVGHVIGLSTYFVLQLLGQLSSSAIMQAAGELLSGSALQASDLLLQAAVVALTFAGGALSVLGSSPSSSSSSSTAATEPLEAEEEVRASYALWRDKGTL